MAKTRIDSNPPETAFALDPADPESADAETLIRAEAKTYLHMLSSRGIDVDGLRSNTDGTIRPENKRRTARTVLIPKAEALVGGAEVAIGATIAKGGMGVVREGEQLRLRRAVAVKVVNRENDSSMALGGDQIVREALVTGALEHPNIVPVHTLTQDEDGMPALVMKRIEGVPWSKLMRDPLAHNYFGSARSPREFHIGILMQVCNAVHFAHSRGIVHRDLKPANVMVGKFGEVYLLDWGIAVSIREESAHLAPPALDITLAGTPAYMAPEMAACRGDQIDERTDVYMLGAILHEIVTGRRRHRNSDEWSALVSAFLSAPVTYDATVPRELADICNQAMCKVPAGRFVNAEAFRQGLARFEHNEAARALGVAARERLELLRQRIHDHVRLSLAEVDEARHHAAEIHKLAAEARFGFQQALRAAPDNADATRGYEEVLLTTIDFHLREHNRDAANALLAELEEPPASLQARFARLDEDIQTRRRKIAALHELARGMDMKFDGRTRARNIFVLAAALFVLTGAPTALGALGVIEPGYPTAIASSLLFAFVGALVGRRQYRSHEMGAKLRICLVTAVAWLGLLLTFSMVADVPFALGIAGGLLTLALAMLVVGLALAKQMIAGVPPLVLGAFGVLLVPSRPGIPILLGTVGAFVVVGVIVRFQVSPATDAPLSRIT